jgi:flagellar assembly factor FliW
MTAPAPVTVHSDLLGTLTLDAASVIAFPDGLYGFPGCRAFALVPAEREGVYWLQSADQPALAFLLVDPFVIAPGYSVDLTAGDLADLGADEASSIAVLAIVTLPPSRAERPTANLQGPLALNLRGQLGRQLATAESSYSIRHEFELPK